MKEERWIQRLNSYNKAFSLLSSDIELAGERELSDIEKRGLILAFEFTYELAWNVIRDFYEYIGETGIQGSRDAINMAVKRSLITAEVGRLLMQSIKSRNKTVHTYNEETAEDIFQKVTDEYYEAFKAVLNALISEREKREL